MHRTAWLAPVLLGLAACFNAGGSGLVPGLPQPVSPTLSTVVVAPSSVMANGTPASVTVMVRSTLGLPLSGQTVSIAVSGTGNTVVQPAVTDILGMALGSIASTQAGAKVVAITVNPGAGQVVLSQTPSLTFDGDPSTMSASSTAVASPATNVLANGTATSTITVTVVDANGNALAGIPVALAASGSNNTLVQPAPTDANGVTTGTIASTRAETKNVTVTLAPGGFNVVLSTVPTVQFIADLSTMSGTSSTAVASPATFVVANGTATSTITVTLVDANGNALAGVPVALAASGTNNTLVQPGVTDANGVTTGTIASIRAETKNVVVTAAPGGANVVLSTVPTVQFIGDLSTMSATLSTAVAVPATNVVANGTSVSTITVTAMDANSNPLPGVAVGLAATGSSNTLVQPGVTNGSGVTSGTLASTTAQLKTVTVTLDPSGAAVVLSTVPAVAFIGDASTLSATLSTASASPATNVTANGTAVSTITVTARDVNGNVVPAVAASLAATGSNNTLVQPGVTNGSGVTTGTIASIRAETKNVTVTLDPSGLAVVLSTVPAVAFIADVTTAAAVSTAVANPTSNVVANGTATSTVSVTAQDANGNLLIGVEVLLTSTGSNNTFVQPAVTNGSGMTSGTIASTRAQTKSITVRLDPSGANVALTTVPTVTFIGDVTTVSGAFSTVVPNPPAAEADGVATSTIIVTVNDINSNPLPGFAVAIAVSGTGNTVVQTGVTDTSGTTSGTVASNVAEAKTVAATIDPGPSQIVITQMPTVTFVVDFLEPGDGLLHWGGFVVDSAQQQIWDDSAATWGAVTDTISANNGWHHVTRRRPVGLGVEKLLAVQGIGVNCTFAMSRWNGLAWVRDFLIDELSTGSIIYRSFDLEYEAVSGRALFVYANNSGNPQFRVLSNGTWSASAPVFATPPSAQQVTWIELAVRPGTNELALVYLDALHGLHAVIWNGTTWDEAGSEVTLTAAAGAIWFATKGFDAAYEETTGDLMVAWGEAHAGGGARYVTRPASGTWSAVGNINAPNAGADWVVLSPEPGGQRIAASFYRAYVMGTPGLGLATWDGTAWVNVGQYDGAVHDAILLGPHASVAWVGNTGTAVCLYADADAATLDWATWTAAGGWVVQADVPVANKNKTRVPLLRAFPGQNKVMALMSDYSISLWAATFDGTSWTVTNGGAALVTTGISSFHSQNFDIAIR